jgi:uncharacterized protein
VPDLTWWFALTALFIFVGALAQGSIGFGVGMIAGPVVVWTHPEVMPAALIMIGGSMPIASLIPEWRHIDWRGVLTATIGRIPGIALGTWLLLVVPSRMLGVVVGLAVLLAAVLQWAHLRLSLSTRNLLAAGLVSGISGTAAGVGGPPVAMVYAHQKGPVVRSTLAAYFLIGTVMTLTTLGVVGKVSSHSVVFALSLMPFMILGAVLARRVAPHVDSGRTRKAILALAGLSGLVLTLTSLFE